MFEAFAQSHPNEPCIWSRQGEYTWAQTYQRASQYGRYLKHLGVQPLQYVGVYMYNSPDFLFIWMGLLSIGAAPALINYNLASGALVHCVKISGSNILLYDSAQDCVSRIEASQQELRALGVKPIVLDASLKTELDRYPTERPSTTCFDHVSTALPLALMYTRYVTGKRTAEGVESTMERSHVDESAVAPPAYQKQRLWAFHGIMRQCLRDQKHLGSDQDEEETEHITVFLCIMVPVELEP